LNPAPSYLRWPHHGGSSARHINEVQQRFSHTYPERFWPKGAGYAAVTGQANRGIWYEYGDLDGVVKQLVENPFTRQAVLPVWFPEDTGATDRRVPCSLFYHFMCDEDMRLSVWYSLRACDFVRHWHNDVYFAARLLQWIVGEVLAETDDRAGPAIYFTPGELNMTISSLHAFLGDEEKLIAIAEGQA
jgi:thymidylate synthase